MSRWTRLVRAVCDELQERHAIDTAAHRIVVSHLREEIQVCVDRIFSQRFAKEEGAFKILMQLGRVYLRTSEAAEIAGCSERTIKRAMDSGELASFYAGADPRIRLADLEGYLARKNQGTPGAAK